MYVDYLMFLNIFINYSVLV